MTWNKEQQPSLCPLSHNVMLNDAGRWRTGNNSSEANPSLLKLLLRPETLWQPCQAPCLL
jgi:hypothetical protein